MLVGNSKPAYAFTRSVVWALRIVAPASIAYSAIILLQPGHGLLRTRRLVPLHVWVFGEAFFYFGIYLQRRAYLQSGAFHPVSPDRSQRERLVQRIKDNVADLESYLSKWFLNAKIEDIKRENLKEFFAWALFNECPEDFSDDDDAEMDGYIDQMERAFGRHFEEGRGSAVSLRLTIDPVPMQHRPLLWYGIVYLVDLTTSCRLWYQSYTLYRQPGLGPLVTLPQRWHTLFSRKASTSPSLSYWYRQHTSKTRLPVLFIHGIGVGIFPYVGFLDTLLAEAAASVDNDGGQIGIIALELMSMSSRICSPSLDSVQMRHEIHKILNRHGWTDFVLAGHSYGTAIASNLMQHEPFHARIKAVVLMDPICICLHLPDVAYNFTRRLPTHANEHMLYYFASQDMMISHTLARHFFWSEYILWKEEMDLTAAPVTVTLSGRDLIVPKEAVWKYLTGSDVHDVAATSQCGDTQCMREYDEDGLRVMWFDDFDHAGLLASKGACRGVARQLIEYCRDAAGREDVV